MAEFSLGAPVPTKTRSTRTTFTPAELQTASHILSAWRKAGPQLTLAAAVEARVQVGDGVAYADKLVARKAAGHIISLMRRVLGDNTSGTLHVVVGPATDAMTRSGEFEGPGVAWGMFFGPFVPKKARKSKTKSNEQTSE